METIAGIADIKYADFSKLDIRVAKILQVEDIEGADKLYKLTIDTGLDTRIICAGIKEQYTREGLIGKKIVVLINLEPRTLRGIQSQGMLLAASSQDHLKISLIIPDQEIEVGSRIN